jgi:hypothetical protein
MQNAFIESFNGWLRDERLNEHDFHSLFEAKRILAECRKRYNVPLLGKPRLAHARGVRSVVHDTSIRRISSGILGGIIGLASTKRQIAEALGMPRRLQRDWLENGGPLSPIAF